MSQIQTQACSLADRKCVPCQGGTPPLKGEAIGALRSQLNPAWEVMDEHHLARTFKFRDFAAALAFVNKVAAIAEEEGHHPDIRLSWGKVRVETFTHKIGGLSESDFVLAAKIDRLAL
jgi:4a-hydroxytetrahydrobiopterin dehydratase